MSFDKPTPCRGHPSNRASDADRPFGRRRVLGFRLPTGSDGERILKARVAIRRFS
jgi:hypothetical protein